MICLNCGKAIDDDLKVCPFCGSMTEGYNAAPSYGEGAPADLPAADPEPAQAFDDDGQDFFDENPVYPEPRKAGKLTRPALPALVLSALACVFSLACLIMMISLRSTLREQNSALTGSVSDVQNAVNAVNDRLSYSPRPTTSLPASPSPSRRTSRRSPARWRWTDIIACSSSTSRAT